MTGRGGHTIFRIIKTTGVRRAMRLALLPFARGRGGHVARPYAGTLLSRACWRTIDQRRRAPGSQMTRLDPSPIPPGTVVNPERVIVPLLCSPRTEARPAFRIYRDGASSRFGPEHYRMHRAGQGPLSRSAAPGNRLGRPKAGRSRRLSSRSAPHETPERPSRRAFSIRPAWPMLGLRKGRVMATEVIMPQMGESIAEGTITKWLKKVGRHGQARRADLRDLDRQGGRRDPFARRRAR